MKEKRQVPRQAVHKTARVLFDRGCQPINCVVLNLTNHGAGVRLVSKMDAPNWFEFEFR